MVQYTHRYRQRHKSPRKIRLGWALRYVKEVCALIVLFLVGAVIFPNGVMSEIGNSYEALMTKLDFRVEDVVVHGVERIEDARIRQLAAIKLGENIMNVDVREVRARIEQESWVSSAVVERVLPHRIVITVQEEQPQAIFVEGGKKFLVNRSGKILSEAVREVPLGLIIVTGAGASSKFEGVMEELHAFQDVYQNVTSLHLVGGRRWDVKLSNNIILKLPKSNIRAALELFSTNFKANAKQYKMCSVDLRLIPDKIYLRVIN